MRSFKIVLVGSAIVLATAACGSSGDSGASAGSPSLSQSQSGSSAKVVTKLLSFEPKKLSVKVGTTVTWEVSDQIGHTVTTGTFTLGGDGLRSAQQPDGKVDMPLAKGKPVSYTFDKPGTYTYYCSIHKGMNGEVEVTP
jgi:plastocyanin